MTAQQYRDEALASLIKTINDEDVSADERTRAAGTILAATQGSDES